MTREPDGARQSNGLSASAFVPLTDVEPEVGGRLLDALGRARIAAYLLAPADAGQVTRRLYVASDDRVDARGIVAAAIRGMGGPDAAPAPGSDDPASTRRAFDELVSDWRIDTVAAVRDAERDLAREDADWRARINPQQPTDEVWLDDDHYVPPAAPPLPRLAKPTIFAMTVLAVSVVLLGIGGQFGLASTFTLLLGVCGMVLGFAILFSRLREHRRDDDDDGSAV